MVRGHVPNGGGKNRVPQVTGQRVVDQKGPTIRGSLTTLLTHPARRQDFVHTLGSRYVVAPGTASGTRHPFPQSAHPPPRPRETQGGTTPPPTISNSHHPQAPPRPPPPQDPDITPPPLPRAPDQKPKPSKEPPTPPHTPPPRQSPTPPRPAAQENTRGEWPDPQKTPSRQPRRHIRVPTGHANIGEGKSGTKPHQQTMQHTARCL